MVSNTVPIAPLPDPRKAMEERDRSLALAYVRKGQPENGVSALARELTVARKVLERAINRQLPWAIAEFERLEKEKRNQSEDI
ncbi:hypothetical protein EON79_07555 [bacterium]|nr:MAG: hypothetical protein EON79_07555 [bacterium]